MGSKKIFGSLLVILMCFLCSSEAYKFYVGGKDGWVLNPHENYNHWAERTRFQVNDTLFFKYNNGSDSVLVVTKDDYNSCNTKNPIQPLTDGESIFKFDRSGPFFFISGNADNCNKGQKLIIVVLAVRNKTQHQSPPPPSPSPSPVVTQPVSPSPASPPEVQPPVESPQSAEGPSGPNTQAPAPSESGSVGFGYSVGLVLGSLVVSVVLGGFLGMV